MGDPSYIDAVPHASGRIPFRLLAVVLLVIHAVGIVLLLSGCDSDAQTAHPHHRTLDWIGDHCKTCPDCDAAIRRRLKDNETKPQAEAAP